MAFLRRNYKKLEWVKSERVNGKPRIHILARFDSLEDFKEQIASTKTLEILRRKSKDQTLNQEALLLRAKKLFSGGGKKSSINTTLPPTPAQVPVPVSNPHVRFVAKSGFNKNDFEKYRVEFEKELKLKNQIETLEKKLQKKRNYGLLFGKVAPLLEEFLKGKRKTLSSSQFQRLKFTAYGPEIYRRGDNQKWPSWSLAGVAESEFSSKLSDFMGRLVGLRTSVLFPEGYRDNDQKFLIGRADEIDYFMEQFLAWIEKKSKFK